jgi:IS605 OrfB family transposase
MTIQHIHRTAVFTVHNPTRHIRAVLDHTFSLYTIAYTTILHHFASYTVEELHAMAIFALDDKGHPLTSTKQLVKTLFGRDVPTIKAVLAPLESSLRESLQRHVSETLMSYLALVEDSKQTPSYPERLRTYDVEPIRLEALDELKQIADNKEKEDAFFAQLQKTRQSEVEPIPFCRIEAGRNCGLFYNPETKQFYARLFVVSTQSRHAKPLTLAGQYIDIRNDDIYMREEDAKKQEDVESFGKGVRSIMVLLEMGKWHEQVLRFTETAFFPQRLGGSATPATPVSAHLVKYKDDYQLHVSFRLPKPDKVKPQTLLGIDRGITCLAAGAVVTLDGKQVLETFLTDGTELSTLQRNMEHLISLKQQKGKVTKGNRKRANVADQYVHLCANQIVELAIKHQSQVVMEDLSNFATPHKRPKFQQRSNFNKMLPRRQYQKIQDAVNAKLALVGLPPIRTVYAAFTSLTCTACGNISQESRDKEDRTRFVCSACGHEDHADCQAGVNIARKTHWLALRSQESKTDIPMEQRTSWASFARTFRV